MTVLKFVWRVVYCFDLASPMNGDAPWDTRYTIQRARINHNTVRKGNLETHMRLNVLKNLEERKPFKYSSWPTFL